MIEIKLSDQYTKVLCTKNKDVTLYLKGYVYYKNKRVYADDLYNEFILFFDENYDEKDENIRRLLEHITGNFSIIVETTEIIICISDLIRTIPLFYYQHFNDFIISDRPEYLKMKIRPKLDKYSTFEFLLAGIITNDKTLFQQLRQTQAGEYLVYEKKTKTLCNNFYHKFCHEDSVQKTTKNQLDELDLAFKKAFRKLNDLIDRSNDTIVVPLSGGLDSRIIISMLKKMNFKNVICYSYGNYNNIETKISKKIARSLKYDWYFVEYSNQKWDKYFDSKEMETYFKYAANYASLPVIQEFIAVKELMDKEIIPHNSIFLPGHTGMIYGGRIPNNLYALEKYNEKDLLQFILKDNYNLWEWDSKEIKLYLTKCIKESIADLNISNINSFSNALELFDFKERQTKFIINSIRLYEFFGHRTIIPLCDSNIIFLFQKISLNNRFKKYLVTEYVKKYLFIEDMKKLQDITCTSSLNRKENNFIQLYERIMISLNKKRFKPWTKLLMEYEEKYLDKVKKSNKKIIESDIILKDLVKWNPELKLKNINSILTLNYIIDILNEED